jgi:hypothetical protein
MALEAGSTYFKGLFTTGLQIADEKYARKARFEAQSSTAEQGPKIICMSCESEEDANALESVFKFIYTHTLPAPPSVSMLYKVCNVATYTSS